MYPASSTAGQSGGVRNWVIFMQKNIWAIFLSIIPRNRFGDCVAGLIHFVLRHKHIPNLRNPQLYNDFLIRIKVGGTLHLPLRGTISDKHDVKAFLEAKVGRCFPRTIALLDSAEAIRSYDFPAGCIVKPALSSGSVIRVEADNQDIPRDEITAWLHDDLYARTREANYQHLNKRVMVEELIDFGEGALIDYKIHCFSGKPQLIEVMRGRFSELTENYYSTSWNQLPITFLHEGRDYGSHAADPRPENLEDMLRLCERLAEDFPFIRVDCYTDGKTVYVGELTNLPQNGAERLARPELEYQLGRLFLGDDADDVFRERFVEPYQAMETARA
jgi:hypothetical protein